MDFLANYGIFLAKIITVIAAIAVVLIVFTTTISHAKSKNKGKLQIKKLNDRYKSYTDTLNHAIADKKQLKQLHKSQKRQRKAAAKEKRNRIFIINFDGDIRASAVAALREEITAVLTVANDQDAILVRLDSGGGMVNAYGLAASQLQRIKEANIKLLVAIDKVAASGGYMMACVADHIMAAPFAIIGSIGVLAQLPNFHRLLKEKNIDFEQLTAGEFKRTLTLFGENTKKGREKMQQEINDTHELFKDFIKQHRGYVDTNHIATGEHWYASQALERQLIDELKTSDDYLLTTSKDHDLYEVCYKIKKPLTKRFAHSASEAVYRVFMG